ncbi:hypothetical protein PS858_05328 [Pseudomonas fluorescens]|jgi:hypothetical protein|uniref:Lipoprotein n=1 Tax=Pseudomonas fluorescens TaxID=294 RepID=A0A5E7PLE9_PSEFL|nr:hypothetical protein [Pseudomonas fluorescens]VVM83301.1 hypothetical protein PS676_02384 [Pseudomonas fluorescens]VVN68948.1 hypothetical protein PS704_00286 [Pseudomonas fluorescens]VVP50575.1 hypothetical protein PS858_05328 [Pseudomonas fluorescens]
MIMSRLTALALATLLSSAAFAANTAPSTGPTDPVEKPKSPAIQSAPGINTNGTGVDSSLPPSTGTDPRIQGNDAGRQGGMNMPDTQTPDNAGPGIGSKTTTGGSGSEGGASQ